MTKRMVTSGVFGGLTSNDIRFLCEVSKDGAVDLVLFGDELAESITGEAPKFPLAERQYFLESVRYVESVHVVTDAGELKDVSKVVGGRPDRWVVLASEDWGECEAHAARQQISFSRIADDELTGFPKDGELRLSSAKKVIVTGCFDWFHSGHVRFLEEASEYGDLYVVVGHDKNIELLKGSGHPMFREDERRFVVGSIKFVTQCLISTGDGWLDAEPEISRIRPDYYVVNEDGDKDEKREFCKANGIEYVVLKREPKSGLTRRTSTNLRGF